MSNHIHTVSDTQIESKSENLSINDTNIFENDEYICKNWSYEIPGATDLPSDFRKQNYLSNDSNLFYDAFKINFPYDEIAENSLQSKEIETIEIEGQQRYFHNITLEPPKSQTVINPPNNSTSNKFKTTRDEDNNSKKELLKKKRGRKPTEKKEKNIKI